MGQIMSIRESVFKKLEEQNIFRNPNRLFKNIQNSKPWRYNDIMNMLHKTNVAKNEIYKKTFGGFYQVRLKWKDKFYYELERSKRQNISKHLTPEKVMRSLYKYDKKFHYSFASKLLHTVNPSNPVIDRKVLNRLDLKKPEHRSFDAYEKQYQLIKEVYKLLLKEPEIKKLFKKFDKHFPKLSKINPVKKLDFILWQL